LVEIPRAQLVAGTPAFVELKARTHYSFLTGASEPQELFARARELGMPALGIADRNGVYGIPRSFKAAQESGVRLIVGAELALGELARPQILTMLAKTRAGYGVMCRLLTEAFRGREKGEACLSWDGFLSLAQEHASAARDVIFLCGADDFWGAAAFSGGGLAPLLEREEWLRFCDRFAGQSYWLESRFLDGRDAWRRATAREVERRFGLRRVASNDVYYHAASRRPLQDALVAIRENVLISECGFKLFQNAERHLKSEAEMVKLFSDDLEIVVRTGEIAEMCAFSPAELRYYYPSEWIPQGETAQTYLTRLVWEGAERIYGGAVPDGVRAQLNYELKLIHEQKYEDYFLTIWEIVEFSREQRILYQGRGSAANSIVCYCLRITAIDPVEMNLLFERFISAERDEPPDIDVDFEHERREEVIQHIYEKYGFDRAAMVAAVNTYHSKSITRDLGRVLGLNPDDSEVCASDLRVQRLGEQLRGFPRHLSIHSGGFTLSATPMIEIVPIEPARMEGRRIVQWDKEDLAIIGLLKVDVLALGMLSALRKTFELVQPKAPGLGLRTVPIGDPATYAMIGKAKTVGVFQIESRAQMGMLGRLLPKNFYDLVVQVAIVRPGPIVGQMVHPYLKRRRGEESIDIPHEKLRPILGRTLGVPLFQEQIMKMAIVLAGFTPGESDQLRRAIGAWRSAGTIEKMGLKLKAGLLQNGLPLEFVERVFKQVQGFAEYGFPESHAASFALLAYASAYLKCHFPAEFTVALINSQPMGFYSVHTLLEEVKRDGVRVLPVHPNRSVWDCALEGLRLQVRGAPADGAGVGAGDLLHAPEVNSGCASPLSARRREAIRLGFRLVRGMSEAECAQLVTERERGGAFLSFEDFLGRTDLKMEVLQSLALGDAFVCFGLSPRAALWRILAHSQWKVVERVGLRVGQLSLFQSAPQLGVEVVREFGAVSEFAQIREEYQSFRFSTKGHPMGALREMAEFVPPLTSMQLRALPAGSSIVAAGLVIVKQRPSTAKGTCFATLEDEAGFLDLILHAKTYARFTEVLRENPFILVYGRTQRDTNTVNVIVTRIKPLGIERVRTQLREFR